MKVALLFSGQPRFVNSVSYQTIKKHLLDLYDCDVYCHCWFSGEPMPTAPWSGLKQFVCDGNEIDQIINLYKPIGFEYDLPIIKNGPEHLVQEHTHSYNLSSMYKSMKRVYEVYEKYKKRDYDVLIRIRYDLYLERLPDLNQLEKNCTFTIHHHQHKAYANNIILSTNPSDFKLLMNIYDKLDEFNKDGIKISDEDMIYYLFYKYDINHVLVPKHIFLDNLVRSY